MDTSISLTSPAKLNLFLHINGRRSQEQSFSGYHELQTAFQLLDRGDLMHFAQSDKPEITISPEFADIKLEENLVFRAANLLKEAAILEGKNKHITLGAHIHLEKNMPMGGGVGGGSSNAATTLLALNHIWQLDYNEDKLARLGEKLGADVPVFVRGASSLAEGIGEKITPIKLPEYWYVILTPDCHINTSKIFSHERLTRDTPKKRIAPALEGHVNNDLFDRFFSNEFRNDFEPLVTELNPEVGKAIEWLNQHGESRLTGTGACCFCHFHSEIEARQVLNEAKSKFKGFIAKGVNLSPAIQRLNEAKRFAMNPSQDSASD